MALGAFVSPRAAAFGYLVIALLALIRICSLAGPLRDPVTAD